MSIVENPTHSTFFDYEDEKKYVCECCDRQLNELTAITFYLCSEHELLFDKFMENYAKDKIINELRQNMLQQQQEIYRLSNELARFKNKPALSL